MLTLTRSAIIDKLQSQIPKDGGLIFAYLNYKERETQKLTHIVESFGQQLAKCFSTAPDEVREFHKKHVSKDTRPSIEELLRLLHLLIGKLSVVYFVIDALDECEQEMKGTFISILRELSRKARLLCTSRPLGYIEERLSRPSRLEVLARNSDIQPYVAAQIKLSPKLLKYCQKLGSLQGSITEKLVEKAQGMYVTPYAIMSRFGLHA
jgi:hypothetical protein